MSVLKTELFPLRTSRQALVKKHVLKGFESLLIMSDERHGAHYVKLGGSEGVTFFCVTL